MDMDRDNYKEFLQSNRVHVVQEIKVSVTCCPGDTFLNILENILTAVLNGRLQLKKLDVTGNLDTSVYVELPSLDPALLSQALVRLEEFSFCCSYYHNCSPFSRAQLVAVFTEIEQTNNNNLKLKSLYLGKAPK